jgi:WD40 repeat protein
MAPEQAQGRTSEIGPATDVHALGAIFYEALTGKPPFQATSVVDTLHQVVHQQPTPPRSLRPNIPADLERICLRCLQKEPTQRYASAAALADDLRRHLTGQPVQEQTLVLPRPGKKDGRRRQWTWIGAAGILVLLVGIGLVWRFWPPPETRPDPPPITDKQEKDLAQQVEHDKKVVRHEPVTIPWIGSRLTCLAFSPDGQTVALGGKSDIVELWDVTTGERRVAFAGHPREIFSLAFAPSGKILAVAAYMQVWLWDVHDAREPLGILKGHNAEVRWVGFVAGGKSLLSLGSYDSGTKPTTCVKIWDVDTRKLNGELDGPDGRFHRLELSPNGKYLAEIATMPLYDFLKLWDVGTKKFTRLNKWFDKFAFAPDGQTLAVGSGNKLYVLEVPTLTERGRYELHTEKVCSVAVSPDGQTLASGSHDRTAILWNIATKNEHATLKGHTGPVQVRFSPDGKMLATGSPKDPFVKLWDVATGKRLAALTGHTAGIASLHFSPDGQILAAACQDGTVKFWSKAAFSETNN